jgi:undecaprenyl-diphosphatase
VISHLLEGILKLPPGLALALVFLLPALEASVFVGVVVPGEIGVVFGGVLANQDKLALWAVFVAGIAGAVIGDSIGYWVGEKWGETLLLKLPKRIVKPDHLDKSKHAVRRFGGKAVFIGRFAAALRAFVPGLCGMSRLPYGTFFAWNALGGATWATIFIMIGYLAGSQYRTIESYANYIGIGILVIILGYIAFRIYRGRHQSAES